MRRACLSLLMALLFCGAAAAAETIKLRPSVTLAAGPVRLYQIADLNADQAGRLGQTKVASLPAGRNPVMLGRARILQAIQVAQAGDFALEGPAAVEIKPQLTPIDREDLVKLFVARVMSASPWRERGRIEITDVRTPAELKVLPADLAQVTADFAPREDFLGQVALDLKFGTTQQTRLSGQVKVYASVPVARGLKAHQPITAADLEMKELELSSFGSLIASLEQCQGLRAKAAIRPGQPLLRSQVEPLPLVCRGENVQIEAVGANLTITDSGVALKDGFARERIPIKNAASGRTIIGTVIAPSRVRVVF